MFAIWYFADARVRENPICDVNDCFSFWRDKDTPLDVPKLKIVKLATGMFRVSQRSGRQNHENAYHTIFLLPIPMQIWRQIFRTCGKPLPAFRVLFMVFNALRYMRPSTRSTRFIACHSIHHARQRPLIKEGAQRVLYLYQKAKNVSGSHESPKVPKYILHKVWVFLSVHYL